MTTQCTPDKTTCEFCGRELERAEVPAFVVEMGLADLSEPVYRDCDCAEAIAAREERIEAKWMAEAKAAEGDDKSRMVAMARHAGMPERYIWKGVDDRALYDRLVKTLEEGYGLYLWSSTTGNGKTHMACVVGQCWLKRGHTVRFLDADDLEREVKATWSRNNPDDEASVIARYASVDLLIIDDIGAEDMGALTLRLLRAVISKREANGRLTAFTSNCRRDELAARIAEGADDLKARRLASRIKGMTKAFEFPGPDRRAS